MKKIHVVQLMLFLLTFILTTISGAELRYGKSLFNGGGLDLVEIYGGLVYSLLFLTFLTFHEFGHYFTALKNNVKVTLPFYIPMYLGFLGLPSIGSMGAFISIRERVKSRRAFFDIGVAGPLAGFVVAVIIMIVGFLTLPSLDYIFEIHPEYIPFGENYREYKPDVGETAMVFKFGSNLLFHLAETYLNYDTSLYPYANEVLHYPFLMVAYIALFFTAINLLPIGQLDGGHIIYGLFGKKMHGIISRVCYIAFMFYAGLGFIRPDSFDFSFIAWSFGYIYFLYVCLFNVHTDRQARLMIAVIIYTAQFMLLYFVPSLEGYPGWLLMGLIVGRVTGIDHPETENQAPLDLKRKIVGFLSIIVFVVSFSPRPFVFEQVKGPERAKEQSSVNIIEVKKTEDSDFTAL